MCVKRLILLVTRRRKPGSAAMRLRPDQGETALGCNWDPAHGSGHRRPGACSSWQHLQGARCPLDRQFTLDISPQNTVPGRGNAVRVAHGRGSRTARPNGSQPAAGAERSLCHGTSRLTTLVCTCSILSRRNTGRTDPDLWVTLGSESLDAPISELGFGMTKCCLQRTKSY